MRLIGIGTILFGMILVLSSWEPKNSSLKTGGEWKSPPEADKVKNPFEGNVSATEKGKNTFKTLCAICHGNKGKGDGIGGMALDPKPSNFTTERVQSQSDGALFWKITQGRTPMASYKEDLTEDQRWQVINYIRTLKKVKK
jgi:mono/diheme cytochrome c family protein